MGLETSTPGCGPGLAAGALILGWGCTTAILPPDWLHPRVPPPFRQSQAKPSSNQGLQGLLWGGQGHRSATPGPRTPGQTRICDPPLLRAAPPAPWASSGAAVAWISGLARRIRDSSCPCGPFAGWSPRRLWRDAREPKILKIPDLDLFRASLVCEDKRMSFDGADSSGLHVSEAWYEMHAGMEHWQPKPGCVVSLGGGDSRSWSSAAPASAAGRRLGSGPAS